MIMHWPIGSRPTKGSDRKPSGRMLLISYMGAFSNCSAFAFVSLRRL
jgi:hypothetical protein